MKGYQVRFLLETMAVLFEKKRDIITLLDDISTRMEELEVELEQMMIDAGFDINNDRFKRGWWDSNAYDSTFKIGLDADGACECEKREADSSYRMD
jgi:hypothetical protein